MPTLQVNDETIRFERAGKGPPLILIHSLGTGAWLWREQIARWAGQFDVLAIDARGHGGSSCRGGFSVRHVAMDILAVARALDIGPAGVVAISMGGPIAAHLVDLDSSSVTRLLIADSFATQGEAGAQRADAIAATIAANGIAAYGRTYATETLAEDASPARIDELAGSIAGMVPAAYVEAARAVFTSDVTGLLRRIAVPTRVVVGSRDQRTPPALAAAVAALVPGADLHEIEGARHLANLDRPEEFHALVDPFLDAA